MRLPNGFGTCYKLKGNRRKPWVAQAFVGRTDKGRSIYDIVGYYETKKEGIEAIALRKHNPIAPKSKMTLLEVYTEWSANKYSEINKSTADNYRAAWNCIKRHSKELFRELRTSHWQAIIREQKENGKSLSHMQKIKILITSLYGYAIPNDVVNKDYGKYVKLPPEGKSRNEERFTDPEVLQLEKAAKNTPWVDTVLILIYTGFRIGELLCLTRFNVDLQKLCLTGGSKTEAGTDRVVPIHPKILSYVQKWYNRGGETLICNEDGKKLNIKYYREKFYYPALEAAGVRKLTPHRCRHTFASRCAEVGMDPKTIQQLLGHTDYAFTANKYTHLEIEKLASEMGKMQ